MEIVFIVVSIFIYVVVGLLSALLLWVTLVFYPFFWCMKSKLLAEKPEIEVEQMPVLRPVPHPMAANKGSFRKFLVYLYVPRIWQLVQNWHWTYTEKDGSTVELVLPGRFECDAASIPRPFRAFFNPTGLLLLPALLHDYGFQYNQLWQVDANGDYAPYLPPDFSEDSPRERSKKQKKFWDELLFEAGMQVNDAWLINKIIWLIRGLSGPTWKGYRKENKPSPAPVAPTPGSRCVCQFNP